MRSELADPRLMVPPLPPLHVSRTRLVTALDHARESPLVLLSAGPGAGKTVLLSDWASRRAAPLAWLTVSPSDNEPHRFWPLFLAAVRASGASADDLPASIIDADVTTLLESLFIRVPPSHNPLTIIIDDAHVLTHPQVRDGLDRVIQGWNPHIRLVLAARSDPLLPLHRYRLSGRMTELRAADLAMTRDETRTLLNAHGVALPAGAFDVLAARTEGWTAGIRLSAIRMAGTEHPAEFVAEFALDQGSVGEYLINEVLSRQPAKVRQLLMQTGFLDEVSGPLADAVTGVEGCAEMLAELARSNSFVIPLDPGQTRFRYHQLFAEILQHLMRQRMPRLAPKLHSRAATWYEAHGDLRNALKWVAQTGDGDHAGALLARGGLAEIYVHHYDIPEAAALLDLLHRVPNETAEISAARSAITAVAADREIAAQALRNVQETRTTLTDPHHVATSDIAELMLAEKAGDPETVDEAAARLLDVEVPHWIGPVPGVRASILLSRARARFWDGRYDEVDTLLQEALLAAESAGSRAAELEIIGMSALVNTYLSRPSRATKGTRRARELQRAGPQLHAPLTLELAAALRAFVEGDFAAMARHVQAADGANDVEWDLGVDGLRSLVRAQLFLGCGQFSEARLVLHGMPALREDGPTILSAHRDMMLASIETALGRPHGALRLLRPYRNTRFAVPVELPTARAYLALGDLRNAHQCIRRLLTGETSQLGRYMLIEALLCDAEIAQIQDDPGHALEVLVRAVEIADDGIVLPFVRYADVFASLLARHPTVAARWPRGAEPDPATVAASEVSTLPGASPFPEPLTDRERAVLRFLTTSMSTEEIADELCVSVNTIKTHLAAIYRKLAARRRREAVLRAREFELL